MKKIILCHMPWATTQRPSIAIGILERICGNASVPVQTVYANIDMAARVGFAVAGRLANERALYGFSEHVFAADLFGAAELGSDEFIRGFHTVMCREDVMEPWNKPFQDLGFLLRLRDSIVPAFLEKVATRVLNEAPTVVGFSVTFNQVMSSLALARRLKVARPEIVTIFGGASFDGEMGVEYHRKLPAVIDHVFLGEADESFKEFLAADDYERPRGLVPGVTYAKNGKITYVSRPPPTDLNQCPIPDYDSFFQEAKRIEAETGMVFNIERLPFETSRGCWWGQKSQCLFCGINPEVLSFRAKDVERVVSEVMSLSTRYQVLKLTASDWVMPKNNFDALVQRLSELDLDLEFFFEVRSSLTKDQLSRMKRAGITHVQPGIESFSTPLLRLMRKGASAIRQIQFLKWCRELGISVSYNLLGGFPGERAEWYLDMARLIPRLRHLAPPEHNLNFVELHRFSPLFREREELKLERVVSRCDYLFNAPEAGPDSARTSYFFDFTCRDLAPPSEYFTTVRKPVGEWIAAHKTDDHPRYEYSLGVDFMLICDTRNAEARSLRLADLYHDIVLLCDEMTSRNRLIQDLCARPGHGRAESEVRKAIGELVDSDLLFVEGEMLLSLPIGTKPRSTQELREYVLGNGSASSTGTARAQSAL